MKPADAANDNLTDRTLEVWQPRLKRNLGRDDARQIAGNITGFFAILAEWSRAETHAPANDIDAPAKPIDGEVRYES